MVSTHVCAIFFCFLQKLALWASPRLPGQPPGQSGNPSQKTLGKFLRNRFLLAKTTIVRDIPRIVDFWEISQNFPEAVNLNRIFGGAGERTPRPRLSPTPDCRSQATHRRIQVVVAPVQRPKEFSEFVDSDLGKINTSQKILMGSHTNNHRL